MITKTEPKTLITKSELKTLEQETKLYWMGLLVLMVKTNRSRLVKEAGSPEAKLIGNISQGSEDRRPRRTDRSAPAKTEEKKTASPSVVLLLANQDEATSLAEALQAEGVIVGVASNPQEAYALTAEENVKVCVVDGSFIKTATDTWRLRKDRVLPVAVIGSSPEREGWDRVVQLDADAYLSKDTSRAEQVARIKALLRRA